MYRKNERYRNSAVLNHARNVERCMFCGVRPEPGSIVAAHSNQSRHGKAMGVKAHDCFIAYLCMNCHELVDAQREDRVTANMMWQLAHEDSLPLFSHLLTAEGHALLDLHS